MVPATNHRSMRWRTGRARHCFTSRVLDTTWRRENPTTWLPLTLIRNHRHTARWHNTDTLYANNYNDWRLKHETFNWNIEQDLAVITFCVSVEDAKCIMVTRVSVPVCLSVCVCLSAAVRPHYCTDPDVTRRHARGCPLVVHYSADLQSGHGLRCYGNTTRTLVTSLRPSRDMTT